MSGAFLERFQAEAGAVLTSIFTHSCDCIKLLTLTGELEYVSDSARDALGVSDISDAVGSSWPAMWPEAQQPALRDALARAAQGESVRFVGTAGDGSANTRHWEVTISPVRGRGDQITHLLAISTEATAHVEAARFERERREQAEREHAHAATIARELRHRLKNQLAVVGAVTKLLSRHTETAGDLARKLDDKLLALARAQDVLTVRRDAPIAAREAINEILTDSGAGERIEIGEVPEARLSDEAVQQLALLLGELQTNALKYGALKVDGGRVGLRGSLSANILSLRWSESCGAPLMADDVGSGGFELIRRLGSAGSSKPSIGWKPDGIEVEFHLRALE